MFLVNDGLFEHFLINKVHENVEIRGIENIQIPFRTHGNVLFRTCYRMYSCVKFNYIFLFLPQKGAWWFHWAFTNHWHQMYHSYQTYDKSLLRLVEIYSWRMLDFVKVHYYWPESHQDQGQISPKAKINFRMCTLWEGFFNWMSFCLKD